MSELPPPLPTPLPPPVLPYAHATSERPGILTAIGVISIILGCLSILTNLGGIMQPISLMTMRSMTIPAPPTTGPATVPANPLAGISLLPAEISAALSLLEASLGVYLLVAGTLVLRNRPSSRAHHLRFAKLKIPVAVLAAAASAWMQYDLQQAIFSTISTATAAGPPSPGMSVTFQSLPVIIAVAGAAFGLAFSLAYPIVLVFALRRRDINAYFSTLGA